MDRSVARIDLFKKKTRDISFTHTLLRQIKGILTSGNLAVKVAHLVELLALIDLFLLEDLSLKKLKLLISQVLANFVTDLLFIGDVVGDVVDLISSSLNSRIQSHRILSRVLQILLQIGNLPGKSALG